MKKILLLFAVFFVILMVAGIWFANGLLPVSSDKTLKKFDILPGETASQIGQDLQKNGFIKNSTVFRIYSQVTQAARNIKPGTYDLSSNQWMPQIIVKLLSGPTEVWVTIPEGLRREEIANKFVDFLGLKGKEADDFYNTFISLTKDKEGYLFPDTYLVNKDATASQVVKTLEDNFRKRVNFNVSSDNIILASILERETRSNDERPIVAGILLKRINAGWPLNADATIQYVVGTKDNYWPTVTAEDLKMDSPYNSYVNLGLPPTPICNPGLSSIKAAINPQTSDYWYYLHDKDGQIHYAVTLDEQNANIAKYLQ